MTDREHLTDRRLSTISIDIKEMIAAMAALFIKKRLIDPYIVSVDSMLLKAKDMYGINPL